MELDSNGNLIVVELFKASRMFKNGLTPEEIAIVEGKN